MTGNPELAASNSSTDLYSRLATAPCCCDHHLVIVFSTLNFQIAHLDYTKVAIKQVNIHDDRSTITKVKRK